MSTEKIDALIDSLSEDLKETKPMKHPLARMFPLLLVSFTYAVAVVVMLGLRDDWMNIMFDDILFTFEFVLSLCIFVSAGLTLGWTAIPDMGGKRWLPAIPITLTGVFMFWAALRLLFAEEGALYFHLNHCSLDGVFMLILPVAVLTFFSRQGATTCPLLMAGLTVLSFSGLAWAGLRMTCGADNFSHAFLMHFVPFLALGIVFGVFARKIFRW